MNGDLSKALKLTRIVINSHQVLQTSRFWVSNTTFVFKARLPGRLSRVTQSSTTPCRIWWWESWQQCYCKVRPRPHRLLSPWWQRTVSTPGGAAIHFTHSCISHSLWIFTHVYATRTPRISSSPYINCSVKSPTMNYLLGWLDIVIHPTRLNPRSAWHQRCIVHAMQ